MTGKEAVRMAIGREWGTSRGKITRRKEKIVSEWKVTRRGWWHERKCQDWQ